jgi:protein required for attachment to host cells
LRHAIHADVKSRIIAEIGKDLTKHPVDEIEKNLVG